MTEVNNIIVIILAAGKGTRMKSNLPKVLHLINNKPMLLNIINVAESLNPYKILVVVGYKKNLIIQTLNNKELIFVEQKNLTGTADAIKECIPNLKGSNRDVLILSGDVPLILYPESKKLCL